MIEKKIKEEENEKERCDSYGKEDTRKKERERAFTHLMKKCVDEVPGNGTFIAPGAPCAVLAVGLGLLGLDSSCIDGSDLGAEVVLLSVC